MKNKLLIPSIIIVALVYLVVKATGPGDFDIYTGASVGLFKGSDIYKEVYLGCYHYYYSLLFAILIFPLCWIPIFLAKLIWLIANAFFLYRIVKLVAGYFDVSLFTQKQKWLFFALCFAFALEFIQFNFSYAQVTILMLYLSLEGLRLIFSGKHFYGALCIALGINIKLLPIVLLPYLIYRKEFKASAWVITIYAALLILPGFVVGFDHNNALLTSWWHIINPMNTEHIFDEDEASFHSLSTLLATLLVEKTNDFHAQHLKRNIANISISQLTYILNTIRLLLVLFSFYFFRTRPFVSIKNKMHRFWEVSYLLLLVPLIFPHQQMYAFLFVAPAACCVIYYLMTHKGRLSKVKFRTLFFFTILSYLACNITLLLGEYNPYYVHFKVLTYGALLLIPLLAICVPEYREAEGEAQIKA